MAERAMAARAGLGRRKRATSSRSSLFVDLRLNRRLRLMVSGFLVLIVGIVGYNAHAMAGQRGAALIINVTARQRSLAERYIKDVLLVDSGYRADPKEDAQDLLANAYALLNGGEVPAVQGADGLVRIAPVGDARVAGKLEEERRLLGLLTVTGDRLITSDPEDSGYGRQVQDLRVIGAQLSSISNDAVGQMTKDAEAAFGHLVVVGIGLGLFGAVAAVAMGLLLRRAGAQQSAKFRSLVHNASDLITVVDAEGRVMFQSPSVARLLGVRLEETLGTRYPDLADAEGAVPLRALIARLSAQPSGTDTIQ